MTESAWSHFHRLAYRYRDQQVQFRSSLVLQEQTILISGYALFQNTGNTKEKVTKDKVS